MERNEDRFMSFLAGQLAERGWSQRELARRAGLSQAAVSRVIAGDNRPGLVLCEGIAKALDLPLETVLIEAGIIQGSAEIPPEVREWAGRLLALPKGQRQRVTLAMENVLRLVEGRDPR
jgi:transcriptional regulator with XRE-family HTH domain